MVNGLSRIARGGVLGGAGVSVCRIGSADLGPDSSGMGIACARNGDGPRCAGFCDCLLSPKPMLGDFFRSVDVILGRCSSDLSGLVLGLLPVLEKTSLNLLAGDFPRVPLVSTSGRNISALSISPDNGGSSGTLTVAGDLGEGFWLEATEGSMIDGKCSVEMF